MSCALLLLAAGGSSRMGDPKMLRELAGQTIIQRAVDTISLLKNVQSWVILGSNELEIKSSIIWPAALRTTTNPHWSSGMSSSIVAGLKAAIEDGTYTNCVIALADMPLVSTEYLQMIIEDDSSDIVASEKNGQIMPPIKFSNRFFEDLLRLTGDAGARQLVQNHLDSTSLYSLGENGIDIDTEDDLMKASKFLE